MKSKLERLKFKIPPRRFIEGRPLFIKDDIYAQTERDLHTGFIVRLKTFFRRFPRLYSFIFYVLAPALFLGKPPRSIFKYVSSSGLVAEIGSGSRRLHPEIINVDIHPWNEVDVLADAQDLPFNDESLDGIVSAWVLEHLENPLQGIREMKRVLKSGGYLYLATNFLMPFHPSPHDYSRWTAEGLRFLFSDMEIVEVKPIIGPTSAFLFIAQEWLSLLLSFNVRILKDIIWMFLVIVTFPIKLLDLILIRYRGAEYISCGFYVIARKK
ncbi:MAG: type 11 methyltransferase [Parcubacteria group bacterium Gr01-1014_3]|nr:MAG: type 11 methyltransferase [Parcubacteria group bacterium Gr01-1014_3]